MIWRRDAEVKGRWCKCSAIMYLLSLSAINGYDFLFVVPMPLNLARCLC